MGAKLEFQDMWKRFVSGFLEFRDGFYEPLVESRGLPPDQAPPPQVSRPAPCSGGSGAASSGGSGCAALKPARKAANDGKEEVAAKQAKKRAKPALTIMSSPVGSSLIT
jgi:hypothetical protein